MSEPERPPEDELPLTLNSEEFMATRFNTTLFTFIGELAVFDHVFLQTSDDDPEDNTLRGAYVFKELAQHSGTYNFLAAFMAKYSFPMILNQTRVPPCDRDAFFKANLADLNAQDTFPEEWEDEPDEP